MAPKLRVVIVGCGISALTTGVYLLETVGAEELSVRVYGDPAQALETTSCGCAGLWMPFHIEPKDKVREWARLTYARFCQDSKRPETGVRFVQAFKFLETYPDEADLPDWREDVLDFRIVSRDEYQRECTSDNDATPRKNAALSPKLCFPDGYQVAISWLTAVVDMPQYLRWLIAEFQRLGGVFQLRRSVDNAPTWPFATLSEAFEDPESTSMAMVVVNATGLGAQALCHDGQLRPALGVLVRVRYPMPFVLQVSGGRLDDPQYPTYLIPRNESICTCGGTVLFDLDATERERYLGMSASASTLPVASLPSVAQDILNRCRQLYPPWQESEADLVVVELWSGLRPVRQGGVRLELETWSVADQATGSGPKWVIHNYGHGGGGVTVSWGCAASVSELIGTLCRSL
ncbi:hypothetical protein CCYA_CCYA09G2632 [Cyanidiococcus yangmingshanensis]|nr:hypothetical protein CCYA_CCYA09G2632 [Cyanidiococcus yangmingshanensis]